MAGTAGNLGWAESGAQPVTEPIDALKGDGYANSAIPTSANWNWLLREHGRAAVRRYDTFIDLLDARRSGGGDEPEDLGMLVSSDRPMESIVSAVGSGGALQRVIRADGKYVFVLDNTVANSRISRYDADTLGNVIQTSIVTPVVTYLLMCIAGPYVYGIDDTAGAGNIRIIRLLKSDLSVDLIFDTGILSLAAGGTTTPLSIETEPGEGYIAVSYADTAGAGSFFVRWYYDARGGTPPVPGPDISYGGANATYAVSPTVNLCKKGAGGWCVALDGNGVTGDVDIYSVGYGAATLLNTVSRLGNYNIDFLATDRRAFFYSGQIDAGGDYGGYRTSRVRTGTGQDRWEYSEGNVLGAVWTEAGIAIIEDATTGAPAANDGRIRLLSPYDGEVLAEALWDTGNTALPKSIAYDGYRLYVLGFADAASGATIKVYGLYDGPRLYTCGQDLNGVGDGGELNVLARLVSRPDVA